MVGALERSWQHRGCFCTRREASNEEDGSKGRKQFADVRKKKRKSSSTLTSCAINHVGEIDGEAAGATNISAAFVEACPRLVDAGRRQGSAGTSEPCIEWSFTGTSSSEVER